MRRITILLLTAILVSLLIPTPAKACSGILCLIWDGNIDLGVTDRAKINAEANVKKAEMENKRQTEIANINAQRDQVLKQAEVDIERQRVAGLITTQQAETARAQFQAQTDAWAAVQTKLIGEHYETQRDAIEQQTEIGLASIHEVGETARLNLNWSGAQSILLLILIVVVAFGLMHFRLKTARPVYIGVPQYQRLERPSEHQIIDAGFHYPVKKDVEHDH